jgi:hypothetical protein
MRRSGGCKTGARASWQPADAFCAKSLAAETKIRTVSSCVAPYGASRNHKDRCESVSFLTFDGNAQRPDVSAAVERT